MKKTIGLLILSLAMVGAAQARIGRDRPWGWDPPPKKTVTAPEIDPASAMSAFTLLAGGLAVIRGRRGKK